MQINLTAVPQKIARGITKDPRVSPLQVTAHLLAWVPLALLLADAAAHHLTANPIQYATQRMGRAAILLLVAGLAVTPARIITGSRAVQKLARPLGLYAFFYALLHVLLYAGVDYSFDPALLIPDLADKPYIYIGAAAFVILLALAVTSFRWWMKRLGRRWKRLHRLVYAAGALAVIHYALAAKGDPLHLRGNIGAPLLYAVLLAFLLGVRLPFARRKVTAAREALQRVFLRN